MKTGLTLLFAISALQNGAQTVDGPILTHVVDSQARLRPVLGTASSARIGEPLLENVKQAGESLALLADGTAMRGNRIFEGRWSTLHEGAFASEDGRRLLIARGAEPWVLALPSRVSKVRVSSDGSRVVTLLDDESLSSWSRSGASNFRAGASIWWSFDFAGDRVIAYDPAINGLIAFDAAGSSSTLVTFPGDGSSRLVGVTRDGRHAVVVDPATHEVLVVDPNTRETVVLRVPDSPECLELVSDGATFLLTRDPRRPLWLLKPGATEPLLVVPAIAAAADGGNL